MNTEDHNHHTNCPLSFNPQEDLREIEEFIKKYNKIIPTIKNKNILSFNIECFKNKIKQIAERNKFEGGCDKVINTNTDYDNEMVVCGKYGNELCPDCQAKKKIQQIAKEVLG